MRVFRINKKVVNERFDFRINQLMPQLAEIEIADIFETRKEVILNKKNRSSIYFVSTFDVDIYKPILFKMAIKFLQSKKIKLNYIKEQSV